MQSTEGKAEIATLSRTRRRNREIAARSAALKSIPEALLDQLVEQGPLSAEQIEGATRALKKALIERALGGELTHHLGYRRAGSRCKGVLTHATARAARRFRPTLAVFASTCHVIGRVHSSRCSWVNTSGASQALMIASSRCTHAA